MAVLSGDRKMSISEATSALISKILKMPPQDIMEILHDVEERMHANKRDTRINYSSEVVFSVGKRLYKGYITNINSNGLFIHTTETFRQGLKITLSFELPNLSEHIKITGEIARVATDGIGVAFDIDVEELLERKRRNGNPHESVLIFDSDDDQNA